MHDTSDETPSGDPIPAATLDRLRETAARVLAMAREAGADQAEAGIGAGVGLSVNVRLGEVERISHSRSQGLALTVYRRAGSEGMRKGSASTTELSGEAIRAAVDAACVIAERSAPDPAAGLPEPELLAREVPELDLYHPWEITPEDAVELALAAEETARGLDPRIVNSEGASVSTGASARAYANTHGFAGGYRGSRHTLGCIVIAHPGEGSGLRPDEGMQRDHWYTASRLPDTLEGPEAVGRRAAERALARLGARKLETGRMPVLFAPEVAGSLIGHFLAAVSGGNLYRRSSFLLERLGTQVFPPAFEIEERPRLSRGLHSAPFDSDGVATQDRHLVEDGILQGYLLGTYSARRLGMRSTGNAGGARNVRVRPGALGFTELLREMGSGVVVTELIGMGVNLVTGDYSRGAAGFRVENGEIAWPVEEITVAGNLESMLRSIRAVGTDVDTRGNIHVGSLLVDGMTVGGS